MVRRQHHASRVARVACNYPAVFLNDQQVIQIIAVSHLSQHTLHIFRIAVAAEECAYALATYQLAQLLAGLSPRLLQIGAASAQLPPQVGQEHLFGPITTQNTQCCHDQWKCHQQRHHSQSQQPEPQGAVPRSAPVEPAWVPPANDVLIFWH